MTATMSGLQRFLVGAALAVLVLAAVLGYQYARNQSQKAELASRLATLQGTVDKLNLAAASGDASDPYLTTPAFPRNPPNLDLTSAVLTSATASGVSTGPLQVATQGTEKIGSNTYRTITMNLTITGTLAQTLDFYDRLERGGIHTLVFDNMRLDPGDGRWTTTLQLVVYAQPG